MLSRFVVLLVILASTAVLGRPAIAEPYRGQAVPVQAGAHIWLEGEDAASHTFNRHGWYSGTDVRLELLSPGTPADPQTDGDWLAHYAHGNQPAEATFNVDVTEQGPYTIWLRASSYRVRQWYQLDGGPRVEMDLEADRREYVNLTAPKLDIRFIAWFRVVVTELTMGRHSLTFGVEPHPAWVGAGGEEQTHGGIDVLCITNTAWSPMGTIPPDSGQAPEPGPGDWFPLRASDDPFSDESITDMSGLLHRPAGLHGPVTQVGDGLQFADGTDVKFWGVGANMAHTAELQIQQTRYYAKNGINIVRQHPVQAVVGLLQRNPNTGGRRLDPQRLDTFDRWFATLKERGIYMCWSPFYPHVVTIDDGYPADLYAELPDRGAGKSSSGYVAYVPELQAAEWAWLQALMTHVNPYTGLRYADDPALAILEVHNEDSIFWHFPLNGLAGGTDAPRHTAVLQQLWMQWLAARYGNDSALIAAWGPPGSGSRIGDSITNPTMPIYGAWEMEADGPHFNKLEKRRLGDFIQFLAETQRQYYEQRGRQVRELGFEGALVSTAWRAGGPAAVAANNWTDDALDIIDRHGYFGGGEGGHRITEGDVANGTHLSQPGGGILAVGFQQVEDKPFVMTEWNQNPPNEWKAEMAPLYAFYGMGLQGWDGSMHFAASRPRMGSGWPGLTSYVTETPHYIGQFPALSMSVHRGHIDEGESVAARRVTTDQAFGGIDALTQEFPGGGYDPAAPSGSIDTPPEILAVGRVTLKVDDRVERSAKTDWDSFWDRGAGVITSGTQELVWDYTNRVVIVQSEKTQAVIGFAGGKRYDLPGAAVEIGSETPFVSLILTPLDDRPLRTSSHILITALARDRQLGARYNDDGTQLLDTGGPPLLLEPVQAEIIFKGPSIVSVRPLDVHGVPIDREVERIGSRVTIDGRYATYCYEVRRLGGTATPVASPSVTPHGPATATPDEERNDVYLPRADTRP